MRKSIGGTRRHVIFSKVQTKRLADLQKETGITSSEHIRRAVDSYFRLLDMAKARK